VALVVRGGLLLLGLLHLAWGVPAVVAPRWFFDTFPGFGRGWTAAYPPYNEHLMTDVGAAFLALGVLLVMAAWMNDRRATTLALTALLVFSALHLLFHARDRGQLSGVDLGASLASLTLGVIIPLAMLIVNLKAGSRR
jgi:putative Ca2+/H+ antiporter (TMEM165/GDT1 family)